MKIRKQIACLATVLSLIACGRDESPHDRLESIRSQEYAAHPIDPVEGSRALNRALDREAITLAPQVQPRVRAAIMFVGYYVKNALAVPKVCREHGVPEASYSTSFKAANAELMETASGLVDVVSLMDRAMPRAIHDARNELQRIADAQGTDLAGACLWVEAGGADLAESAQFARVLPHAHADLVKAR